MPKTQRPRNWYAKHISISLKTADRAAAKSKCPEIATEVEQQVRRPYLERLAAAWGVA